MTDLANHILETPLCDTHEHLWSETNYVENAPDILQNLFDNYVTADLVVAGASQEAVDRLLDNSDPDVSARFQGVETAWQAVRHTGYGEAVRTIALQLYGIEELTADTIEGALDKHQALCQPGQRLHLLRDLANLDHVQIDDFTRDCAVDPAGPDFFFYDISWWSFCNGTPELEPLADETGVEVVDLQSLQQAMGAVFERNADVAIAVKSQHAYERTLTWQHRTDLEAEAALATYLQDPENCSLDERLCLGDWCWAKGIELAIEYDLPFKLHTGYYAGHSRMPVDFIRSGNLCPLLARYLDARLVLMHISYPYSDELVALAKHYPNVYPDLCWAWSIDPYGASDFVRRCIHAIPANKLFIFGGDTFYPGASLAYAQQARTWLTRTLQAEIDDGLMGEREAINLASAYMRENQYACFRLRNKREKQPNLAR